LLTGRRKWECQQNAFSLLSTEIWILSGTLGISKDVPVGFESIRAKFKIDAPEATSELIKALQEKSEQYCVLLQTMLHPPKIESEWNLI
jgi:uncharacterized OsmC-like protein